MKRSLREKGWAGQRNDSSDEKDEITYAKPLTASIASANICHFQHAWILDLMWLNWFSSAWLCQSFLRLSGTARDVKSRQTKVDWRRKNKPGMLPYLWPPPWHSEPQTADMMKDQVLQSKPDRDKNPIGPLRWWTGFVAGKSHHVACYHDTWALERRPNTCHIVKLRGKVAGNKEWVITELSRMLTLKE